MRTIESYWMKISKDVSGRRIELSSLIHEACVTWHYSSSITPPHFDRLIEHSAPSAVMRAAIDPRTLKLGWPWLRRLDQASNRSRYVRNRDISHASCSFIHDTHTHTHRRARSEQPEQPLCAFTRRRKGGWRRLDDRGAPPQQQRSSIDRRRLWPPSPPSHHTCLAPCSRRSGSSSLHRPRHRLQLCPAVLVASGPPFGCVVCVVHVGPCMTHDSQERWRGRRGVCYGGLWGHTPTRFRRTTLKGMIGGFG